MTPLAITSFRSIAMLALIVAVLLVLFVVSKLRESRERRRVAGLERRAELKLNSLRAWTVNEQAQRYRGAVPR